MSDTGGRDDTWGLGNVQHLSGLTDLIRRPKCQVLVVFDATTQVVMAQRLPKAVVVAALGSPDDVNWNPLAARKCYVWPDPGGDTIAETAYAHLVTIAGRARVVPPLDAPVREATAGWDDGRIIAHMKATQFQPALPATDPPPPERHERVEPAASDVHTNGQHVEPGPDAVGEIRCLGNDHGRMYFIPANSGQIVSFTAGRLGKGELIFLADESLYWERRFPGKNGPRWSAGANSLVRRQEKVGPFDSRRLRGRGCWLENNKPVLHLGNRVIVDGKSVNPREHSRDQEFIYQTAPRLSGPADTPITDAERRHVMDCLSLIRWESEGSDLLLLGWTVLAPVSGALKWRPHVWLTGGAGSGKSTLLSDFVQPLLGGIALVVLGSTTEAGIRQTLGADALPVVFDEAETTDRKTATRIDNLRELMRQSSSESQARVVKGTAGGASITFHIRSMFLLASIGSGTKRQADTTRITRLALRNNPKDGDEPDQWPKLQAKLTGIDESLGRRLVAATVADLPAIIANAAVFTRVAGLEFDSARIGDQYGWLMAGAYSFLWPIHGRPQYADDEEARQFLHAHTWEDFVEPSRARDEEACLEHLLQTELRVDQGQYVSTVPLSRLIESVLSGDETTRPAPPTLADRMLRERGFRVTDAELIVANSTLWILAALQGTGWTTKDLMPRMDGARSVGSHYFAVGVTSRATALPLAVVPGLDSGVLPGLQ